MYTQTFLVTSVRGRVFAPQTAASASLSFFGAKMPLPAFFMANAFFLPVALWAFFPIVRFFLRLDRLQSRLRDRRLRGLRHRGLRNRLGRRRHREGGKKVQTRLEP